MFKKITKAKNKETNEDVTFGQYETIMISKENGLDVDRNNGTIVTLGLSSYKPVKEVTLSNGKTFVFQEKLYDTHSN